MLYHLVVYLHIIFVIGYLLAHGVSASVLFNVVWLFWIGRIWLRGR